MNEITPCYYKKFRCIAERCKHNCCIGWEIDIDEETMQMYNSLDSLLGERIRNNIEGEVPHFVLGEDERCPFLNECNRCDIISELGEGGLCDICRLHPRFINCYSGFSEAGLGLCCEEAARIILAEEKFVIEHSDNVYAEQDEKLFFKERNEIFSVLQNRECNIRCRFEKLAQMYAIQFDFDLKSICEFLITLERLDENWTSELLHLKDYEFNEEIFSDAGYELAFENLACYFVYRHLAGALDLGDISERVKFVLVSCFVIGALWSKNGCVTVEQMAETARMFSCEIEYSEDNTVNLMNV